MIATATTSCRADIVFVNPPVTLAERYGKFKTSGSCLPQLGYAYLAATLRTRGIVPRIVDAPAEEIDDDEVIRRVRESGARVVGLTATTMSVCAAARVAKRVKAELPGVTTILGGTHMTAAPRETLERFAEFDFGAVGEADWTIVEVMESILGGDERALDRVAGLYLRRDGEIVATPPRPGVEDLDALPQPAFDLMPEIATHYRPAPNSYRRLPATSLITSRGCLFECAFCDTSVGGKKVRAYSAARCMDLVRELQERYGVREIIFHDDIFTFHRKRLIEFCNELIAQKVDLTWSCVSRVDTVTREVLELMAKAGCWQIAFGIESGSQEILDLLNKGTTLERIRRTLEWCREVGIRSRGYLMIGVPGETHETIRATIEFIKTIALDDFHVSYFCPMPGTALAHAAVGKGTWDPDWAKMSGWYPVFIPNGLTAADLERGHRAMFREFYFRPKIMLSHLSRYRDPRAFLKAGRAAVQLLRYTFSPASSGPGPETLTSSH
jgi:radical SAM superfamily enzyme YgiQ (UPF0313 family)